MSRAALRGWTLVHRWTSLLTTAFLLMLCLTGLPLIFHDEIDGLLDPRAPLAALPEGTEAKSLDALMASALADRPGDVGLFMSFDEDRPVANITTGPRPDAAEAEMTLRAFDMRTGEMVGAITEEGVMHVLFRLHTDLFLGLPGMLFLGAMGLLFLAALVSGVVLYAPFMRRHRFGTMRLSRPRRVRWLDYHNLLGMVGVAWMAVVGTTGVIHTLATPIVDRWRAQGLADLVAPYAGQPAPPPGRLASLQEAVDTARAASPGSRIQFVAFPGGSYSSRFHYAVFLQGDTPLTRQLLTPALVDARTGALAAVRPMPWYVQALQLSRPLHFGDYGGLPLKILWAALTLATIVVLVTGLYLWAAKRRGEPRASDELLPHHLQPAPAE